MASLDLLVAIVRREYHEMPGLRLTFAQACRLWHLEPALCGQVLEALLREQFLWRTDQGLFVRPPDWFDRGGRRRRSSLPPRRRRVVRDAA